MLLYCSKSDAAVLSHKHDTVHCLQLLVVSMFIFTNEGKKLVLIILINEVMKSEKMVSG